MSNEQGSFSIGWLTASADLSAKQHYALKVSGNGTVTVSSAAGAAVVGVLQNKPTSGQAADVMVSGVTKVEAGTGGLTAGALWQTAADGTAIAAASGDYACGIVLIGASAGEKATVTVNAPGGQNN